MTFNRATTLFLCAAIGCAVHTVDAGDTDALQLETPLPVYPSSLLGTGFEGSVEAYFVMTKEGNVSRAFVVESTHEALDAPTIAALRQWTFKLALSDGRAEEDRLLVTFKFREEKVFLGGFDRLATPDTPPRVAKRVEPEYPDLLYYSGNQGRVVLTFLVNRQGKVVDPVVETTTHPAFETPALEAILKWKFTPGESNGIPVVVRVRQGMNFAPNNVPVVDAYDTSVGDQKNVPESLRLEKVAKPKITVFAVHPFEHALERKSGSAEVRFVVGPEGDVLETMVVSASKPEFGLALAAALEAWEFEPAEHDGKPVQSILSHKMTFREGDRDSVIDPPTQEIADRVGRKKFVPANPKELDAAVTPKFTPQPVYPTALKARAAAGSAKIEVIIDKNGRVVLPRIVEASEPEFGWAAATAAQRWRFEPPRADGKSVELRVQIPFQFTPPKVRQ